MKNCNFSLFAFIAIFLFKQLNNKTVTKNNNIIQSSLSVNKVLSNNNIEVNPIKEVELTSTVAGNTSSSDNKNTIENIQTENIKNSISKLSHNKSINNNSNKDNKDKDSLTNNNIKNSITIESSSDQIIIKPTVNNINYDTSVSKIKDKDKEKEKEIKIKNANNAVVSGELEVDSIETNLFINSNDTDGLVTEIVKFNLNAGVYKRIIRRISIEGTADYISNVKLISSDVKLINAKVIKNCSSSKDNTKNQFTKASTTDVLNGSANNANNSNMPLENQSLIENYLISEVNTIAHPYICIIASIEELVVTQKDVTENNHKIVIGYEYHAKHLLKKREKPFSNTDEQENVMIMNYYNFNSINNVKKIDLSIKIDSKITSLNKISLYPEINSNVSKSLINTYNTLIH